MTDVLKMDISLLIIATFFGTTLSKVIISRPPSISEEFQPLRIAKDCFPLLTDQNGPQPHCEFWISKNATHTNTECPKINSVPTLKLVGEFDILIINCTASYPLDFLYYGVQPTEAIFIEWTKEIQPGNLDYISGQNYSVEVRVYSVEALFNYFNNPKNSYYQDPDEGLPHKVKHAYSRSGLYSFPGIYNTSVEKSFFLFLEDAAQPSFLQNNKTVAVTFDKTTNLQTIPCVVSHFGSKVEVTGLNSKMEIIDRNAWNPLQGFVIPIEATEDGRSLPQDLYGNYTCTLTYAGQIVETLRFTFSDKPIPFFGLEGFDPLNQKDQIDITGDFTGHHDVSSPIRYTKFIHPICNTKDPSHQVDNENVQMISVPTPNFGSMRLIQQFALPKYRNRSYTAKTVKGGWDDLTRQLRLENGVNQRMGTVYCGTGYGGERIQDYGSGIRVVKLIPFNFGLDWVTFNRKTSPIEVHFGILPLDHKPKTPIYIDSEVVFECRVNVPVLVKPVVWTTALVNGTIIQEKIDYNLNYDTSTLKVRITADLKNVSCASSYWYSDFWRNISYTVESKKADSPKLLNFTETVTLELGASDRSISCSAIGEPQPSVYFERDSFRLSGVENKQDGVTTSILYFPQVSSSHAGVYTCVAKNVYETRKEFRVSVEEKGGGSSTELVLIITIPLLVFALTTLGACIYMKYFRPEKTGLTKQEIEDFMKGLQEDDAQIVKDGNECNHEFALMRPYVKEYEIAPTRFKIDESMVLGKGAFGLVLQGTVDNTVVAVKTVQRNADKQYLKALLSELKIMIHLGQHENLVPIIGACTKDLRRGFVYVFVKYLALGNMQNYLRNHQQKFDPLQCITEDSSVPNKQKDTFGLRDMMKWSMQIANGMEYLGSKHVIHGDLALRNVLLDLDRVAKITDFGLSRQLYDYNDYIKKQSEPLPWRWMSLESLKYLSFNKQSDIWSYGVTIWEIFSLGEVPYPGYTWNLEFVDDLDNGLRMTRPKYGSTDVFGIMASCWNADPLKRPPFSTIKKQLLFMIEPLHHEDSGKLVTDSGEVEKLKQVERDTFSSLAVTRASSMSSTSSNQYLDLNQDPNAKKNANKEVYEDYRDGPQNV